MRKTALLILLAAPQLQCSPYFEDCSVGILPFSGQSAVDISTEIHFHLRYISEEQPGFVEDATVNRAPGSAPDNLATASRAQYTRGASNSWYIRRSAGGCLPKA